MKANHVPDVAIAEDGTIVISANGQRIGVAPIHVKELMRRLGLSLANITIREKLRRQTTRPTR